MGAKLIIMGGLAVTFGATSYYAGNQYLESQTQARLSAWESSHQEKPEIALGQIVIAAEDLQFGERLEAKHLKVVTWPADHRPPGSFADVNELIKDNARRVVTAMQKGEPLLASKLTGKNGRGGLAGVISEGMRAVTIPVNTVNGVGGFVQPGDRVDIVFTHEDNKSDSTSTRIIMTNVKVLSIDQVATQRSSAAQVAKSVTLETNAKGAQKLALARNIGSLSLLLRSAGDDSEVDDTGISVADLSGNSEQIEGTGEQSGNSKGLLSFFQEDEDKPKLTSIRVMKGEESKKVTVPIEKVEPKSEETKPKE